MPQTVKTFLIQLLYEAQQPSLTRCLAIIGYAAFLAGTAYLMLKGQRWEHYETFATITGGGGAGLQAVNKYINSKYNTTEGNYTK